MNTSTIQQKPPAPAPAPAAAQKPKSRMSIENVKKGVLDVPHRVLIYGPEKVGKTTFAAGAPDPILMGKDSGTEELDIARMPQPERWRDIVEGLNEIENGDHKYKTLVLDPVNWLEPLINDEVIGDSGLSIERWDGGFGRGYDAAILFWRMLIASVERIWLKRKMHIVMCAHTQVKKFNDPKGPGYDRYELEMANKRAAGMLKQWAATILFAQREAYGKVDATTKRARAYGSAARIIHTEWQPAFDAGNRQCLPPTIAMSWNEFAAAAAAGKNTSAELLNQIEAGLAELADPEVEKKVRGYLADKTVNIVEVANALASKLGEKREAAASGNENTNSAESAQPKEG